MPIKHAIWTIGDKLAPLALTPEGAFSSISRCLHPAANKWRGSAWSMLPCSGRGSRCGSTRELATEKQPEDMIVADPRFVSAEWMLIGCPANASTEVGLFGNQNSVCKPTTPSGATPSTA